MPDLFDYLTWRGDLSMEQVPLGPVDALILTTLCYVRFHGLVPEGPEGAVCLGQAAKEFLNLPKEEREKRVRSRSDEELVTRLMNSNRFAPLELSGYVDRLEADSEMQFSAITVGLGRQGTFVAFRGTDNTLVGWKEDFNMSFQDAIPAQWTARDYLERCAGWFPGRLMVGGHSKGGNLAVFSAAMCRPQVRARVRAVYNHDGPGFTHLVMGSEGYQQLLGRVHTFVPQSSVVGMLLEHQEPYIVVKSRQIGIFQHDPYSWEVLGGGFICLEDVTEGSKRIDQTVKNWIASLSPQERGAFVDAVYELLQNTDADKMSEVMQPKNLLEMLRAFQKEDLGTQRVVAEALGQLIKAALQTGRELKKEEA